MELKNNDISDRILSGDLSALDDLYISYGPRVLGYVMRNSGSRVDGEDVLQFVIAKIWENVTNRRYTAQGTFDSYFLSVMVFTWRDELRKRKRSEGMKTKAVAMKPIAETENAKMESITYEAKNLALHLALKKIGNECRHLITSFHYNGVSLMILAEEVGKSYGALRKQIHDCRNKLKKLASAEFTRLNKEDYEF